MRNQSNLPRIPSVLRGAVCMLSFFAIILALVLTGLARTSESVRTDGLNAAEAAVRRSALCCYALEGAYPESYEYLKENYPPGINEKLYTVRYTAVAPALPPVLAVLRTGAAP